jgi:hypothetical protein
MVQELTTQPSVFGRLGKGLAQGISEVVPKEVERQRLASGLQQFEQNAGNLTPIQQLARLSAIPGITPQMIQSFSDLARQQNLANAYGRSGAPAQGRSLESSPQLGDIRFANLQPGQQQIQPTTDIQRSPNVAANEYRPQEIVNENPLAEKNLPKAPWTPQKRDATIRDYIGKGFLPEQAQSLAADDERRELASPSAYQARLAALRENENIARDALRDAIEQKLQKKGEAVFQDITGEALNNLERGMSRDLRANPEATVNSVVNDWSQRALDMARAKKNLAKEAGKTGIDTFFKGSEKLKSLNEFSKTYRRAGNSEELYNTLQQNPENGGFGLTPWGAATIAFPVNSNIKNYIEKSKPGSIAKFGDREGSSQKAAIDLEEFITENDSILSIMNALRNKDQFFDYAAFLDQIRDDQDRLRLNERQRRELQETRDITPNWGDILIFPFWRK